MLLALLRLPSDASRNQCSRSYVRAWSAPGALAANPQISGKQRTCRRSSCKVLLQAPCFRNACSIRARLDKSGAADGGAELEELAVEVQSIHAGSKRLAPLEDAEDAEENPGGGRETRSISEAHSASSMSSSSTVGIAANAAVFDLHSSRR